MPERTYTGPLSQGRTTVDGRLVRFTRGEPVEFSAEEVKSLDGDWSTKADKPEKSDKSPAKAASKENTP